MFCVRKAEEVAHSPHAPLLFYNIKKGAWGAMQKALAPTGFYNFTPRARGCSLADRQPTCQAWRISVSHVEQRFGFRVGHDSLREILRYLKLSNEPRYGARPSNLRLCTRLGRDFPSQPERIWFGVKGWLLCTWSTLDFPIVLQPSMVGLHPNFYAL